MTKQTRQEWLQQEVQKFNEEYNESINPHWEYLTLSSEKANNYFNKSIKKSVKLKEIAEQYKEMIE